MTDILKPLFFLLYRRLCETEKNNEQIIYVTKNPAIQRNLPPL